MLDKSTIVKLGGRKQRASSYARHAWHRLHRNAKINHYAPIVSNASARNARSRVLGPVKQQHVSLTCARSKQPARNARVCDVEAMPKEADMTIVDINASR